MLQNSVNKSAIGMGFGALETFG